ncbi:MAG TPA: signal peptidase I [Acidimicrobiia bacterium]|jgi:signal peptidase|nr:signal peptidase I [Acidimicrobiia bacterium]
MSTYEGSLPGRHIDNSRLLDWLTRHLNPVGFVQWMLVIVLALVLWPSTLGGRMGLVMVAGHSMEPTYQLGDAVIAWRQPVEIGDIILYRIPEGSPGEGKTVIHRVIGGDGNGWVTQGDNTARPDMWHPSNLDVLGVAQMKLPLGGEVLAVVRSWWFIAAMGGLAMGLFLWPDPDQVRRGRHRG